MPKKTSGVVPTAPAMRSTPCGGARATAEAGFGLIEIVVSMFLLGVVAIAFLPLLVQSLQVSTVNATIATATQLVSEQLEKARAHGTVCSAIPTSGNAISRVYSDLTVQRERGACPVAPAGYPGVVSFRVAVVQSGSTTPLAEASTLLVVNAP